LPLTGCSGVWLYRTWPKVLDAMVLVKPATVIDWHCKGFRSYWRRRSRHLGRPGIDREIRDLIRKMSTANPLSRAYRWQKLLDDGVYGSIAEMADKERINRSYLSRTIRLSLLAPDIVEAILNGTQPPTLQLADLEGPFSIDWEQQRTAFGFRAKTPCALTHFEIAKVPPYSAMNP
jgi:hypothetical protein